MSRGHEYMDYKGFYTTIFTRYRLSNTLILHFQSAPKKVASAFKFLAFASDGLYEQDQMFRPIRKKWLRQIFEFCPLRTSGAASILKNF